MRIKQSKLSGKLLLAAVSLAAFSIMGCNNSSSDTKPAADTSKPVMQSKSPVTDTTGTGTTPKEDSVKNPPNN